VNFFQAQQNVKTSTFRLLVLFIMAILCIVLITDMFVYISYEMAISDLSEEEKLVIPKPDLFAFLMISGVVIAIIGIGSAYKSFVLSSGGGRLIAESMGARLVRPTTENLEEKRLMNVVEEMAIASGMPVPQVYILDDEHVINAFAAGLTTSDAVIGVTKGTINSLTRDELQGVIAHEYSHILNGDMALNIQLISMLHGILIIGMLGYYIFRSTRHSRSRDSAGIMMFGIGLIVIGYGGTFFGNIIKSSISRQREYLADASAVQFTRNPEGIAGALKKIGGMTDKSLLKNDNAHEMSHAYFSQGVTNLLGGITATHPPLKERIRRIDPRWNGEFVQTKTSRIENAIKQDKKTNSRKEKVASSVTSAIILQSVLQTMEHMGNPGEKEIEAAREIINEIPEEIHNAIHEPYGVRAIIYCLLINREEDIRKRQLEHIQANGDRGIHDLCLKYLPAIDEIPRRCRLPLIDMGLPILRELSQNQYKKFKSNVAELVAADATLDLFEWCLQKIIFEHLDKALLMAKPPSDKYKSFDSVMEECRNLFSVIAYAGNKKQEDAEFAFNAAIKEVNLNDLEIQEKTNISLSKFDNSLDHLLLLKPLLKESLLKACLASAMTDNKMTTRELELIRAIADTLNCPIPPMTAAE
jgi:Zn-dependent protease with chaperone function